MAYTVIHSNAFAIIRTRTLTLDLEPVENTPEFAAQATPKSDIISYHSDSLATINHLTVTNVTLAPWWSVTEAHNWTWFRNGTIIDGEDIAPAQLATSILTGMCLTFIVCMTIGG